MDVQDGVLAGRYRLLSKLGEGGMGCVWRAYDPVEDRFVAVKEVTAQHGQSDTLRQEVFMRAAHEARSAARLNHPGVIAIYDVFEGEESEGSRPWIIMELAEYPNLAEYVERHGLLTHHQALRLALQLADILDAVHEAGLLHRDIKPSNILYSAEDDRVVLIDFGIAKHPSDTALTVSGAVIGTPSFMAPECATNRRLDSASDWWSVGATLYATVIGESPFQRPTPLASLHAIVYEAPPRLAFAGPLRQIIEGLLQKSPRKRMRSGEVRRIATAALKASNEVRTRRDELGANAKLGAAASKRMPARLAGWLVAVVVVPVGASAALYLAFGDWGNSEDEWPTTIPSTAPTSTVSSPTVSPTGSASPLYSYQFTPSIGSAR